MRCLSWIRNKLEIFYFVFWIYFRWMNCDAICPVLLTLGDLSQCLCAERDPPFDSSYEQRGGGWKGPDSCQFSY